MSLTGALNTARSSLAASSRQMSVVAQNTAGASTPTYAKKIASAVSHAGAVRVVLGRASDAALFTKVVSTAADAANRRAILDGLEQLAQTVGDPESETSLGARLGALRAALQQAANRPDNPVLSQDAIARAQELVSALNEASATTRAAAAAAEDAVATAVERVNRLLTRFETLNAVVVKGTASGADVSDDLDERDALIAQLSEDMGITILVRENNDVALYTDTGATLFERIAHEVEIRTELSPSGLAVGGILITGPGSPMPLQSGAIVGHLKVRDRLVPDYQAQLNALAGVLTAQVPELFAMGGPSAAPAADRIRLTTIDYAALPGRLDGIVQQMNTEQVFSPGWSLGTVHGHFADFAASSAGWLEDQRQTAALDAEYQTTLLERSKTALSNATGVNIDDQTATMLQLEKSYAASAKLVAVVNDMLRTLLDAVR